MILQRVIACGLVVACAGVAHAAVVHRYSFTSNANDSVGSAHGIVVDPGNPTAVFAGGLLDLSANVGNSSDNITEDAFVDLPNGIFSAASAGGAPGQMSIEIWAKASENRNWAALLSGGSSNGGVEGTSPGGGGTDYIQIIPRAGAAGNDIRTTTHAAGQGAEGFVDYTSDLSTTQFQHIVTVYDQSGGLPGTITLYVDGGLVGSTSIATANGADPDINLNTFLNHNNWLGRSQWPDPVFDGFYDEVRIHNSAVSASYVASAFQLGPNTLVPEPNTVVLLAMAGSMFAVASRQRRKLN
jgi:Concanavalin A-like lectin/glucanases superfamily